MLVISNEVEKVEMNVKELLCYCCELGGTQIAFCTVTCVWLGSSDITVDLDNQWVNGLDSYTVSTLYRIIYGIKFQSRDFDWCSSISIDLYERSVENTFLVTTSKQVRQNQFDLKAVFQCVK